MSGSWMMAPEWSACRGGATAQIVFETPQKQVVIIEATDQAGTKKVTGAYLSVTAQDISYAVGDINSDGLVDAQDHEMLSTYLAGRRQLIGGERYGADLNLDETIDDQDLALLNS